MNSRADAVLARPTTRGSRQSEPDGVITRVVLEFQLHNADSSTDQITG